MKLNAVASAILLVQLILGLVAGLGFVNASRTASIQLAQIRGRAAAPALKDESATNQQHSADNTQPSLAQLAEAAASTSMANADLSAALCLFLVVTSLALLIWERMRSKREPTKTSSGRQRP